MNKIYSSLPLPSALRHRDDKDEEVEEDERDGRRGGGGGFGIEDEHDQAICFFRQRGLAVRMSD